MIQSVEIRVFNEFEDPDLPLYCCHNPAQDVHL